MPSCSTCLPCRLVRGSESARAKCRQYNESIQGHNWQAQVLEHEQLGAASAPSTYVVVETRVPAGQCAEFTSQTTDQRQGGNKPRTTLIKPNQPPRRQPTLTVISAFASVL